MASIAEVCKRVAKGDLEARVPMLSPDEPPEAHATRVALNRVFDLIDATLRESSAAMTAAQEGRYYRRFLTRGMHGAFARSAALVNSVAMAMHAKADIIDGARDQQLLLSDKFERVVYSAAEAVAAASTELNASAGSLSEFTRGAVGAATDAGSAMTELRHSSAQIEQIVGLIDRVAAQTRLLALNATIEAARAGSAGRGFAVVATEVKQLSDETERATKKIIDQVNDVRARTGTAATAISTVNESIQQIEQMVHGIASATGAEGLDGHGGGLSETAEVLRAEASGFLATLREDN
jgi:methyl-accepting chemotaxis protein